MPKKEIECKVATENQERRDNEKNVNKISQIFVFWNVRWKKRVLATQNVLAVGPSPR